MPTPGEAVEPDHSSAVLPSLRIRDHFAVQRLPVRLDRKFFDERPWQKAPVVPVPLDGLFATQGHLFRDGLKHHSRPGAAPRFGGPPWIVRHGARYYLCDGHHRAVWAKYRGETHILARVRDSREGIDPR